MEPTLYTQDQLPEEQYHAETGYGPDKWLTRSMICDYIRDKRFFWLKHVEKHPLAVSTGGYNENFILGHLTEDLVRGECRYQIAPETVPYGNKTAAYNPDNKSTQKWLAEEGLKPEDFITEAQKQKAEFWVSQLETTAFGKWFLEKVKAGNARHGLIVRWIDEPTGLRLQCMLDYIVEDRLIVDVKTMGGTIDKFCETARKWGYDVQAAMYSAGFAKVIPSVSQTFLFACMEKSAPYRAMMVKLPFPQVAKAGADYRDALIGIGKEDWNPHGWDEQEPYTPEMPAWLLYDVESED